MTTNRLEILIQSDAFRLMRGDEPDTIRCYTEDFLQIITEFEQTHGRQVPNAVDLIWIEYEFQGRDWLA